MKYKMLVFDLDNTLMKSDESIPFFTSNVLETVYNNGYILMVATARDYWATVANLNFNYHASACMNGALTYNNKSLIDSIGFQKKQIDGILDLYNHRYPKGNIVVTVGEISYYKDVPEAYRKYNAVKVLNFDDFPDSVVINRLVLMIEKSDFELFRGILCEDLTITDEGSNSDGIMKAVIWNSRANKLRSIYLVAKKYNINKDEIVAFGDSFNDIEMLKECGLGVAVSNSIPEAIDVADFVCGSNDEEGVAQFIKKRILNN